MGIQQIKEIGPIEFTAAIRFMTARHPSDLDMRNDIKVTVEKVCDPALRLLGLKNVIEHFEIFCADIINDLKGIIGTE